MPKEKVLVVDDDSAIRFTLTEALRGWGYEPLEASTVAAALESFDAERPSAVLQDDQLRGDPATLIERELFGREKGAFTDAKGRKEGLFEQAQGGTLFLDEIGELELGLQAKLLRVLEEGSFRRVGGLKDLPLNVRVVAASNRDLKAESDAGRFRLDLYYRLSVIQIDLPPLRERGGDLLLLAKYYLAHFNERLRKRIRGLTPEVEETFRRYSWPGNVRELRNVIERVMILEDSDPITTNWLPRGLIKDERTVSATPVVAAPQAAEVAVQSFQLPVTQSFQLPDEWRRRGVFSSRIGCRLACGEPCAFSMAVRRFQFRKGFGRLHRRGRIISIW